VVSLAHGSGYGVIVKPGTGFYMKPSGFIDSLQKKDTDSPSARASTIAPAYSLAPVGSSICSHPSGIILDLSPVRPPVVQVEKVIVSPPMVRGEGVTGPAPVWSEASDCHLQSV
jgi:hypothetical protein